MTHIPIFYFTYEKCNKIIYIFLGFIIKRIPIDEMMDLIEQFANAFFDDPTNTMRS